MRTVRRRDIYAAGQCLFRASHRTVRRTDDEVRAVTAAVLVELRTRGKGGSAECSEEAHRAITRGGMLSCCPLPFGAWVKKEEWIQAKLLLQGFDLGGVGFVGPDSISHWRPHMARDGMVSSYIAHTLTRTFIFGVTCAVEVHLEPAALICEDVWHTVSMCTSITLGLNVHTSVHMLDIFGLMQLTTAPVSS